jgi:hypothetical protein
MNNEISKEELEKILNEIMQKYKIKITDKYYGNSRKLNNVYVRYIIANTLDKLNYNYNQISYYLNKDRTTIYYYIYHYPDDKWYLTQLIINEFIDKINKIRQNNV